MDLDVGVEAFHPAAGAGQGASRPVGGEQVIGRRFQGPVALDLERGAELVGRRIGRVAVLVAHVALAVGHQLAGIGDGVVGATLDLDQIGAVGSKKLLAFLGGGGGQADGHGVFVDEGDAGQADTGVARGGFDQGHSGAKAAVLDRGVEHGPGRAILDRTGGVVPLELGEQAGALGGEFPEFDKGCVSWLHGVITSSTQGSGSVLG
ncbi:MAG: hypothetical protein OER95_19385 [Acidimicrobiia bacterium]|nr:hypothetical protein [Acidimicrobiia bacterium]